MLSLHVSVRDSATPELQALLKKAKNLRPVFRQVEKNIMAPLAMTAWGRSGLKSQTGELKGAITPWAGRYSVGVTLRQKKGADLIAAKGHTHMKGRKKGKGYKNRGLPRKTIVRSYLRQGHPVKKYARLTQPPWGDIPSRPFFVTKADVAAQMSKINQMLLEYLTNAQSR